MQPAHLLNLCKMNSNEEARKAEFESIRMWNYNEQETHKLYERGNANARQDAEDCLKLFSHKFTWPERKARVLDIGSGDGSVTNFILSKYIPSDCEIIGSDLNEKVVKYANQKYANERIKFIPFDVIGDVPQDMKGKFDHVFSFYMFHWIRDHEKAFTNIYNILTKNGEFFAIFMGICDVYAIFEILAKRNKWSQWMENVKQYSSSFQDFQDPDIHVSNILTKIGFNILDVRCKQRVFIHEDAEDFKGLITAINGFDIPKHRWSEFIDDFMEVKRFMNLIDENNGSVKTNYNLIVFHCTK